MHVRCSSFPKSRPSDSVDASRAAELKRLRAMTVKERILEALSLNDRYADLLRPEKR